MEVVVIGVISSLIASVVYALFSFGIKPKIKMSDKICVTQNNNGTHTYKIKIVNKSMFQLVNVSYHLTYGISGRDDISYLTEILPKKSPITIITGNNRKNTDYALRVTYEIKDGEFVCNSNSYFEFSIQATHPLSNSILCKKVRYYSDDIAHDCTFQTGKNTDIMDLRVFSNNKPNQVLNT